MSSSTCESQLLRPHAAATETHVHGACAPRQEGAVADTALALQLAEPAHSDEEPVRPKINEYLKIPLVPLFV